MTFASESLPELWSAALRTVVHPDYGIFVVHRNLVSGEFDAFPLDPDTTNRWGIAGFTGRTMAELVDGIHHW